MAAVVEPLIDWLTMKPEQLEEKSMFQAVLMMLIESLSQAVVITCCLLIAFTMKLHVREGTLNKLPGLGMILLFLFLVTLILTVLRMTNEKGNGLLSILSCDKVLLTGLVVAVATNLSHIVVPP